MVIIPSIDLRGGKVVRLQQGDYGRQLDYDVDAIATARSFAEAGAKWVHVVDLDGAKEGRIMQTESIGQIGRAIAGKAKLQCGGGVRSVADITALLASGAQRVVVGTRAVEDWAWFDQLCHDRMFVDRIILALDAKDGIVASRGWTQTSGIPAIDLAEKVRGWPLAAILYTDVARDGMMSGPNFAQTRKMAQSTDIPIIASGGVGSLDHVRQLSEIAVWGSIIGRSLYEGKVNLADALKAAAHQEPTN
jgi:phosphoribosylformimino-5-aminoimidazole carboxamide ribotide isomerase